MRLVFTATLCAFLSGEVLAQHCGTFDFPEKQDATVFQDVAKRAGARVFVSETGDKIGSAFLVDRELGLFLTAAHVLLDESTNPSTMRAEVWLDFPVLLDDDRLRAERLPVPDLEKWPIDIAILRVETSEISSVLRPPELHFKQVKTNVMHHAYGFPGSAFEAAGAASVPGWGGSHECLYDMLIATTNGDSGGAVFEPGEQLAGITQQQAGTRRQFTSMECVTGALLEKLPVIDGVDGGLLDAAEALANRFSHMSMIEARQLFLPNTDNGLTNLEIGILVEGIGRKPERFCELANLFECPLFAAVSDRLGRHYFKPIAIAEYKQKELCATAQFDATGGGDPPIDEHRLGVEVDPETPTHAHSQPVNAPEQATTVDFLLDFHALTDVVIDFHTLGLMTVSSRGELHEQNAIDRVLADRFLEQAARQEQNGLAEDANDFRNAALEHYERYLKANKPLGEAFATALADREPFVLEPGSTLANYGNAYANVAAIVLEPTHGRVVTNWGNVSVDAAYLNALVPPALRNAPGWQALPAGAATALRNFDLMTPEYGTVAGGITELPSTTLEEFFRNHLLNGSAAVTDAPG